MIAAPASARRRVIARPMPRDPPVTSTVLPASSMSLVGEAVAGALGDELDLVLEKEADLIDQLSHRLDRVVARVAGDGADLQLEVVLALELLEELEEGQRIDAEIVHQVGLARDGRGIDVTLLGEERDDLVRDELALLGGEVALFAAEQPRELLRLGTAVLSRRAHVSHGSLLSPRSSSSACSVRRTPGV